MKKLAFCIFKNKGADQLRGNRTADQCLCFRHIDCTISLLTKAEISSLWPSYVVVQSNLCLTWSEIPKTGFLVTCDTAHMILWKLTKSIFTCGFQQRLLQLKF